MTERDLRSYLGMQSGELAKIGIEAPFVDATWTEVPFSDITGFEPKPFQVITGIPSLTAYRDVEEQICHGLLAGYFSDEDEIASRLGKIRGDRITNHLRPENYQNSSFDAHAVLVPFSAERVFTLKPNLRHHPSYNTLDDTAVGIGVIYGGQLRSFTGDLGEVLLEAIYSDRTAAHEKPSPVGTLVRTLGSDITIKEVSGVLAEEVSMSQKNAASVARFALRHVYSGGAPGLGKR